MKKELFGVFDGYETFAKLRPETTFDTVVCGSVATVGIRDDGLGAPCWSASYDPDGEDGACLIWGENYVPTEDGSNAAQWLFERFVADGFEALSSLNGSYLVFLEYDGEAFVATDMVRSWECFYTDESGVRTFGTDSAAVAQTMESPSVRDESVLEFLHMGVVLGEKTCLEGLRRLPIDSYLTPSGVGRLDRFVYEPREFDYVAELAERLERAIRRRTKLPGRKGLLLSSGYDSRTFLAGIPDIETCYTVGKPDAQEVRGARRLATQYGAGHVAFPPDERYLLADAEKVRYSQGIKESLHIHHAGYTDMMNEETIYHGLLCDTFFRGHFTAKTDLEMLGKRVPIDRLDPDPDPVDVLLGKFGYDAETSRELQSLVCDERVDTDPGRFVRSAVEEAFERTYDRADSIQNGLNCCGISNQPSMPFHTHLMDNFFSSFLAVDAELVDWHLITPPEYRTTDTFLKALERLDRNLLDQRPPDRPHKTRLLNEFEGFVRRLTPFLTSFEPPWPDRESVFDRHNLDQRLLPNQDHLYGLPARHKLRFHDIYGWLRQCSNPSVRSVERLFESDPPLA